MNKKLIKLTESDLHKIVKESVNRIMNEGWMNGDYIDDEHYDAMMQAKDESDMDADEMGEPTKEDIQKTNDYWKAVKCVKKLVQYADKYKRETLMILIMKIMDEMGISWKWFNK